MTTTKPHTQSRLIFQTATSFETLVTLAFSPTFIDDDDLQSTRGSIPSRPLSQVFSTRRCNRKPCKFVLYHECR